MNFFFFGGGGGEGGEGGGGSNQGVLWEIGKWYILALFLFLLRTEGS